MAKKKQKDDLSIDFSGLKNVFSRKKKTKKSLRKAQQTGSDEINLDLQSVLKFFKKYRAFFILLIPLALSFFIRIQPADQHYTENWAKDYIRNINMQILTQQKSQEYPNLPSENLNALVQEEYQQMLEQGMVFLVTGANQAQQMPYEQAIYVVSSQYKDIFKDDAGQNYLHDIDTWLWYGQARNYVNSGYEYFGTTLNEKGQSVHELRNGREGIVTNWGLHPWSIAIFYRIGNVFSDDWTIVKATYYISVAIMLLATIPVFFIAKKISGDLGALVAATVFSVQPALLSRTLAGVADSDPWTVFFPVLLTWIFLEAWATKIRKIKVGLLALFGIVMGLFYLTWGGWWYIFIFILGMMGIYFAYQALINWRTIRKSVVLFFKKKEIQNTVIMGAGIPLSTFIFGPLIAFMLNQSNSLMFYFNSFITGTINSLFYSGYKDVGINTHWPNVLTTVAELNASSLKAAIGSIGGNLLFILSIVGIIATILRKDDEGKRDTKVAILLTIWFVGTLYMATTGVRFSALLVPAFAIALGAAVGIITQYVSRWGKRELSVRPILTKAVILVLVIIMLSGTIKSAYYTSQGALPIVNDAWYDALIEIKEDSDDAIISSWWDFGHHFVAIAQRRVTFDGGDQGRRIHWIGKTLLTRDEAEAVGILRMLNCDQEKMIDKALNYSGNDTYEAVQTLYDLAVIDERDHAKEYLLKNRSYSKRQAEDMLESTHCDDLLEQYYITSADMVGKSGVWGHFGSWDFNRSIMYNKVNRANFQDGTRILEEDFGIKGAEAARIYTEIKSQSGDVWISPWPGYINQQPVNCQKEENIVSCENGANFNLSTYDAFFVIGQGEIARPRYTSYIDEHGEFVIKEYTDNIVPTNSNRGVGVSFIPIGNGNYQSVLSDELLVGSMFTRLFYYNGHGLRHFKELTTQSSPTSGKIQVWKVDFEGHDPIQVAAFEPKKEYVINTMGWVEDLGIFDSTIKGWQEKDINQFSSFENYETEPRRYVLGQDSLMPDIVEALKDLEIGKQTIVEIPPATGYPNDPQNPASEELRNKTIYFRIKLEDITSIAP